MNNAPGNRHLENQNSYVHPVVAGAKRGLDIVAAITGLVLALVPAALIALAIWLDSPGPVLFRQQRIGRAWPDHVELFWMFKFRTMREDAEASTGPVWASKEDPRITRIGRLLRKTRLDEIPQLVNVLRGDMSLIGPRPERPGLYDRLDREIPYFAERTWGLRPGITGLAQVRQGYDRDLDDVRSKVGYDHAYALSLAHPRTWLRRETEIILQTFIVVLCGRGQ